MKISLDDFYEIMTDEENTIELSVTEDGDLSIVASDEVIGNQEFVDALTVNAEKALVLSTMMGMLFPDKFAKLLEGFIMDKEGENK